MYHGFKAVIQNTMDKNKIHVKNEANDDENNKIDFFFSTIQACVERIRKWKSKDE